MVVQYNNFILKGIKKHLKNKLIIELISDNYIDGFEKIITLTGKVIYKRNVHLNELTRAYDMNFFGRYKGYVFPISYNNSTIILHDSGRKCAIQMEFIEKDRGVWIKEVNPSAIDTYYVTEYDYLSNTESTIECSKEELFQLYTLKKKYI